MFSLFKSKKRSDVEKPIIAGSLLNLVNKSKAVKDIHSVSIKDIFAVIEGRIDNRKDKSNYPLDKIKEDYIVIEGKVVFNRYKRKDYADMTGLTFRDLYKKLQEEYISIGYKDILELFSDAEVLRYIKNDVYIEILTSFSTRRNLSMSLRIDMWSDDVEQLRQEYLKMIEMIDRVKYGE